MSGIPSPLAMAAQTYGDYPAIICANRSVSYSEYARIVQSCTEKLKESHIERGDRVAILSNNSLEYCSVLMALLHLGAVACPVSPRFPAPAVEAALEKMNCTAVVLGSGVNRNLSLEKVRKLDLAEVAGPERLSSALPDLPEIELDQDATIIFTSGTSATPKGALHSFSNHYHSAAGSNKNIVLQPNDRWLLSLPLYHVGGMAILYRCLLSGAAVAIPGEHESLTESIGHYGVTHLSLVATQLQRFVSEIIPRESVESLKGVLLGGSAIPRRLITKAYGMGLKPFTSYGLTEIASQVTATAPGDPIEKLLTSGRLLEHREIRIAADGEILVKGNALFKGYVEQASLALPIDDDGWFATSDLGRLDADGYLTVTGRKDNMFISGGENIQPEEIEATLLLSDQVEEAIVVPVEDEEFGHRPVAFVKGRDFVAINQRELAAAMKEHLPGFKIPIRFYPWPAEGKRGEPKPDRRQFTNLAARLAAK